MDSITIEDNSNANEVNETVTDIPVAEVNPIPEPTQPEPIQTELDQPEVIEAPEVSLDGIQARTPLDEFNQGVNSNYIQQEEERNAWSQEARAAINKNVLEFDNFLPEKREAVRKRAIINAFMEAEHDVKTDSVESYNRARAVTSTRTFGEALDDDALFNRIQERAQGEKVESDRIESIGNSAFLSILVGDDTHNYSDWGAENIDGSISKDQDNQYRIEWNNQQDRIESIYGDSIPAIRATSREIFNGGDWIGTAASFAESLDDEEKEKFLYGLRHAVRSNPTLEVEQSLLRAGINIKKSGRAVASGIRNAGTGAADLLRSGGTYGFAKFFGSNEAADREKQNARNDAAFAKSLREKADFLSDVRDIFNSDYDPIRPLAEEGSKLRAVEEGVYALPGAVTTTGIAAIPYVGGLLTYSSLKEGARQKYRGRLIASGEYSREEAGEIAGLLGEASAVPNLLLEKLQVNAVLGKSPLIKGVIGRVDGFIKNKVARGAIKFGAASLYETGIELQQEINDEAIQDIAHEFEQAIPDVEWKNGEDGVFDGYFNKFLTTFVAVSPLSIGSAAGQLSLEDRAEMFAKMKPLERAAYGITESDNNAIQEAENISQRVEAYKTAIENRDANSELAKDSVHQLASDIETQQEAEEQAAEVGIIHKVISKPDSDNVDVYDNNTGNIIAEDVHPQQASVLVSQSLETSDRNKQAFVDGLVSQIQGTKLLQDQSGVDAEIRPLDSLTELEASIEFEGSSERLVEQAKIREKLDGGNGKIAEVVLGVNIKAGKHGRANETIALFGNSDLSTVLHEQTHVVTDRLHASGEFTFSEQVDSLKEIDKSFEGLTYTKVENGERVTRPASDYRLLPADFDSLSPVEQNTARSEALSNLSERLILRTQKGGKTKFRDLLNKNLKAKASLGNGSVGKLKSYISAIRDWFGHNLVPAEILKRAEREGKLDSTKLDELQAKLFDYTPQESYEDQVLDEAAKLDEEVSDNPFSVSQFHSGFDFSFDEILAYKNESEGSRFKAIAEKAEAINDVTKVKSVSTSGKSDSVYYNTENGVIRVSDHFQDSIDFLSIARPQVRTKGVYAALEVVNHPLSIDLVKDWVDGKDVDYYDAPPKREVLEASSVLVDLLGELKQLEKTAIKSKDKEASKKYSKLQRELFKKSGISNRGIPIKSVINNLIKDLDITEIRDVNDLISEVENIEQAKLVSNESLIQESSESSVDFSIGSTRDTQTESFQIGHNRVLDILQKNSFSNAKNPEAKVEASQKVRKGLEKLRREKDKVIQAFGKDVVQRAVVDPKTKTELRKEAAVIQATKREELEGQVYEQYQGIVENESLVKLKDQPLHELLSHPNNPLKGRLISESQALKQGRVTSRNGDFDGAGGVSRSVFGGDLMPDQAAQEAYESGLINEPTADALWDKLQSEQDGVISNKEYKAKSKEAFRNAKAEAKEYAEAWFDKELKKQERDNNPRQRIIRALSIHDALALSLPSEVRGKIGGVTKLAKLGTNDSALKYLEEKFARAEKELEQFLSKEADKNLKKLFKRAKAKRKKAGKSDQGKIDPITHSLFDKLKDATTLTDEQVEKEAKSAQDEAAKGEERTAEQVVLNNLLSELLPQFGNWKGRTSNEKTEALANGWKVLREAAHEAHQKEQARREYYAAERSKVQDQVGVEVSSPSLQKADIKDKKEGFKNIAAGFDIELSGFEVLLEKILGTKSEMARELTERQRQAEMLKSQIRREDSEAVNMFFKDRATFNETGIKGALDKTTSKELKGMRRLSELMTPNIETSKGTYSELQIATMIMTWNQPDGRRHMEGIKDENGKVTSHWSYDQDFIDSVQEKLSGDTLEFMDFIYDRYEKRFPQLNKVYKSMNNIDLARTEGKYAPINNNPFMTNESEVDLTSGRPVTSGGFSPNPTKRRSSSAVAQPVFNDALTVFLQNSDAVSHYISHAEFARDFNSIFSQREVTNSIKVKFGEAGTNAISNWNKLFIDGGVAAANTRGKFNRWLFRSTGRLAKMALALKPSVTLIQSTILGGAIVDLPMKSYLKGMAKLSTGQLDFRENWNSEFIQQRYKDQPVMLQMMRDTDPSTAPSKMEYYVNEFAHIGISGADAFFTTATYSIYKDHYKEEGSDLGLEGVELEKYAETKAIKSTERVSQPSRIGTRSIMENTERSPWKILGYAFMSDARLKASLTAHRLRTGSAGERARAIAFFWMINGVGATVLRSMWRDVRDDGEDDEIFDAENWDVKSMTISSLLGPVTAVPVVGELLNDSVSILAGERTFDGTLLDAPKKGAKSLKNADDYLEGDVDLERALRDTEALLTTAGLFSEKAAAAKSITSLLRDVDKVLNNVEE